jgi:hypothetical protein
VGATLVAHSRTGLGGLSVFADGVILMIVRCVTGRLIAAQGGVGAFPRSHERGLRGGRRFSYPSSVEPRRTPRITQADFGPREPENLRSLVQIQPGDQWGRMRTENGLFQKSCEIPWETAVFRQGAITKIHPRCCQRGCKWLTGRDANTTALRFFGCETVVGRCLISVPYDSIYWSDSSLPWQAT